MRFLLLAPVALCLGAAPPQPAPTPAPRAIAMPSWNPYSGATTCPETPMSLARKSAEKPQLRRLDELPHAQAFAAVDRRVDGCPAPLVVRYDIAGRQR